jgi:putative restriction endonuclease
MNDTTKKSNSRLWLVLTFGDERQYAGNAGYEDAPGKWYSYDSFVANHRQVSAGDCVILCDRARALGIARIEDIATESSTRMLQRCPVCRDTGIKRRKAKLPEYRCNKGHEFESPARENASCIKYTAHFGKTFSPFAEQFSRAFLRQGCPRFSDQLAMQEFEFSLMETAFRRDYPGAADLITGFISAAHLPPEAADTNYDADGTGYRPDSTDNREKVLREIRARRGQQGFRDSLRARYGDRCMVSSCKVLHVLEAAHIHPYRGEADNHPENGLLLRADLHTLFDLDMLGIDPATLTVHFHPDIQSVEYAELDGRKILCSVKNRPSEDALKLRWEAFEQRLTSKSAGPLISQSPDGP